MENLYNELYSIRLLIQQLETNEMITEMYIIRNLKIYLIEQNYDYTNINNIIYNFYRYIDIHITYEQINNCIINYLIYPIPILYNSSNMLNNIQVHYSPLYDVDMYYSSDDDNIIEFTNDTPLNDDDINNLKVFYEPEINCCICLEKEYDNIIELPCKHKYHSVCIKKYFNYNYKCPICRYKVGEPK
uniref:RING-type E3 ubiquitin transferase n=1 Tax=viral metagenome TaxID=1070528 RepID=A0A6C0H7Y1_9ZZZZ